ncbi:MAG: hypothetical protein WBC04_20455, partial [Candidatus Acidiferrales bacterium]
RLPVTQEVAGSNPVGPAKVSIHYRALRFQKLGLAQFLCPICLNFGLRDSLTSGPLLVRRRVGQTWGLPRHIVRE